MTRPLVLLLKKLSTGLGIPAELGRQLLFEIRLLGVKLGWRFLPKNRRALKRLEGGEALLNFGCGDRPLAGWVNIDGIYNSHAELVLGLRGPLPLPSGCARFIFSEHLIEHFYPDEALVFLRECHRLLADGGAIRIVAPDLEGMARAYAKGDGEWFERAFPYLPDPVDAINLIFYQGGAHHYIYDGRALTKVLEQAGFSRVTVSSFGQSAWPELRVDLAEDLRTIKSVYVEAVKG